MTDAGGDTTRLLRQVRGGDDGARDRLFRHARQRLYLRAQQMLRGYPGVRRWEETDDVLQNAMLRLARALKGVSLKSTLHFWNLAALQVKRELLDLAAHYKGPFGQGANHDTDGRGKAADDPGRPLQIEANDAGEPSSLAEWSEFHVTVEKLPDEEREAFGLLFYHGLPQEEAAARLNVSLRTVKRRWQSARLLLAKALKAERLP